MYQSWRYKVHEAEEAYKQGRLEQACQLLQRGNLQQYLPGQRLAEQVVCSLADRTRHHVSNGEFQAAWRDFETLASLGNDSEEMNVARDELVNFTLNEIERHILNEELQTGLAKSEKLQQQQVSDDRLTKLQSVARHLQQASTFSLQGEFARADDQLATAEQLLPEIPKIRDRRHNCRDNLIRSRKLTDQLQRALMGEDWDKTLDISDQLLEMSPESQLALDARRRAWQKVGKQQVKSGVAELGETTYWNPQSLRTPPVSSTATSYKSKSETVVMKESQPRFLLWVDAVGGFLTCLGQEVTIGQALPDNDVDIPILGDLPSQHAKIRREGEDYLIEPVDAEIAINGKLVKDKSLLSSGDEFSLGQKITLRFRKPHALSASARLEFTSRHRTQPWADGVILMAESCVLGPNWNNHVVCRNWRDDAVIYRQGDSLACRAMERLEIDGQSCDGSGPISYNSRIVGDDFSMSLEEI